jgi:TIR domain
MASIFISYRRSDAAGHAGRLYDQLAMRFGEANIFKDLDSMEPGADFAEVIEETVARCDALIAVIGSDWVSPRLEDPDDWVRLEIAHALARKVRVVPVLVEGAKMPAPSELPDDLSPLTRRHAVDLSETGWNAQVAELLDRLEALMDVGPTAPVADVMENLKARLRAESGLPPASQGEGGPDDWSITVLTTTKREREFELCFRDWCFPITVHRGRMMDKVTVDGTTLQYKSAKPSKYGLVAPFPLRTPAGRSEGLLNWGVSFSRLLWVSVYVDGEPVYLESPEPLPPEAWPE